MPWAGRTEDLLADVTVSDWVLGLLDFEKTFDLSLLRWVQDAASPFLFGWKDLQLRDLLELVSLFSKLRSLW